EVLADNDALRAVRLDGQNRVQLLLRIAYVDAVLRLAAARDPEEPVQAHDVVDAEDAGVRELVAYALAEVVVTPDADGVGVERREAPVLPLGEEEVGRRADADALREVRGIFVRVVALGVDAQRV